MIEEFQTFKDYFFAAVDCLWLSCQIDIFRFDQFYGHVTFDVKGRIE
jgi:hypothetical protein